MCGQCFGCWDPIFDKIFGTHSASPSMNPIEHGGQRYLFFKN